MGIYVKSLNVNSGDLILTSNNTNRHANINVKNGTPLLDKTQVDNIDDSDNE